MLAAVLAAACSSGSSEPGSVGDAIDFSGSWELTLTLVSSSCNGLEEEPKAGAVDPLIEQLDLAQIGSNLQVGPDITGRVNGRRATWTTTEIAGSVRTTRSVSLDLDAVGNAVTGALQIDTLDQTLTPPSRCTELWSVSGVRIVPTDFAGVWDVHFVATESTCGLEPDTMLADQVVFARIDGELLIGPDNAALVAGRELEWTVEQTAGSRVTTLTVEVVMDAGNQSFRGTAMRQIIDPDEAPPIDCVDEFTVTGARGAPPSLIELRDYFPMQDGDVYAYTDGSTIGVSNTQTADPEIGIAMVPMRSGPALTWNLLQAPGGEFDLAAVNVSEVLPPTTNSTSTEGYYQSNAGAVPAPLRELLPALVLVGDQVTRRADHVVGFVGGASSAGYFGTSLWSVRFGRSGGINTPLGYFPDVIELSLSEEWRKNYALSMPGVGRLSRDSRAVLWLARGFGPIAIDAGGGTQLLTSAIIGDVEL